MNRIIIAILAIMACLWLYSLPVLALPAGAVARLGKGDISDTDRSVAFSADGSKVAAATTIGLYIYDSISHQELELLEPNASVSCVTFSPDGRLLATGHMYETGDPTVRLWDLPNLQQVATLIGHHGYITSVAFSHDGHLLATSDSQGNVKLWDVSNLQEIATLTGHSGDVNSIVFSPDGHLLATGGDDKTVKLWDVSSLQEVTTLTGHTSQINSVAFSPDGHLLATGSDDWSVKLWDVSSLQEVATIWPDGATTVHSVAFSPDGHLLATGLRPHHDSRLILWDTSSFQAVATLSGHSGSILSVGFSPDGHLLATGSSDDTAQLWSVPSLEVVATLIERSSQIVYSALSPNGQLLATAPSEFTSAGTTVVLWDVPRRQVMATLTGRRFTTSLAFSPDGRLLASGSDSGGLSWNAQVTLWDMESLQEVATLTGHSRTIKSLAFSPDGDLLASGSFNLVKLWDITSFQEVATLSTIPPGELYGLDWVNSVAFSPDGRLLAGAGFKRVFLWDTTNLQEISTLGGYSWDVNSVAFSSDGHLLATGSNQDDIVKLWDVLSLQEIATLTGHSGDVSSVAFSPDGSILASGSADHNVKLWNIATQEEIATLTGHGMSIRYIAFSSNNRMLVSASIDDTVLLWDMTPYVPELPNQPPSLRFSPSPPYIVSVGSSIIITVTADDMDGDDCIITADALPLNAELSDNILTFSPSADQVGEHHIAFQADDQRGGTDTRTIEITVKAPPVVSEIPSQNIEDGIFASIPLDNYVSDPDNDDTEMLWTYSENAELAVTISAERIVSITVPDPGWTGSETITFTATDPDGLSDSDSAEFTVEAIVVLGDVNDDGEIRSNDAILALRIAAGLMEPTEYQKQAADMNGDGRIRSNDAILILRKAARLVAPGKSAIVDAGGYITVTLAEAHGVAGESITVPLKVDNVALAGGDISIAYNSAVLRAVDVSSDSDVLLASNVVEPGMLRIAFANADRLNSKTLAKIRFDILADDVSPLTLRNVKLYKPDALPIGSVKMDAEFSSWAIPPEHSALLQNFPNPFNPETWIPYQLAKDADVVIRIYDSTGRLIRKLDMGYKPAGCYLEKDRAAYWDGGNSLGERATSGVYFYQFEAGDFTAVRKLAIVK